MLIRWSAMSPSVPVAQPSPTGVAGSAAVAQPGRDRVQRELDPTPDALVGRAGPVPAEQLDLHHVQRVEIREPIPNAALQRLVVD